MKIGILGLSVPEGKVKYNDPIIKELTEKFDPKKITPFFAEFILNEDDLVHCDAIAVLKDNVLDLLISDMEKLETRLEHGAEAKEKALIEKCLPALEEEIPLCDFEGTDEEREILNALSPISFKPVLILDDTPDIDDLIKMTMDKANVSFFYTAGKQEVRSWFIEKGSDIVECAGKIHSDLARGFIKGDVVNYVDYRTAHNLQDAYKKGLAKLVDRDYIIQEGDVIEVRFNV